MCAGPPSASRHPQLGAARRRSSTGEQESCSDSLQKYRDERPDHIVTIKGPDFLLTKNLLELDKADKHSDKRTRGQVRIHAPERSFVYAPLHIRCKRIAARYGCHEHVRQFVPFKSTEKQQPHERGVLLVPLEKLVAERLQEHPVVMGPRKTLHFLKMRIPAFIALF